MAGLTVNRLTNANVYMDGNSLLGMCEEFTIPNLKAIMSEHKAIGMIGKVELPSGIDKLEADFKWNSYYPSVMKKLFDPFAATSLNIRGSLESYQGNERTAETPVKVFLKGMFKEPGGTAFKQHDNVEQASKFNVTYMKVEIGTEKIVEYDALANILIINGDDKLANYRANLGI